MADVVPTPVTFWFPTFNTRLHERAVTDYRFLICDGVFAVTLPTDTACYLLTLLAGNGYTELAFTSGRLPDSHGMVLWQRITGPLQQNGRFTALRTTLGMRQTTLPDGSAADCYLILPVTHSHTGVTSGDLPGWIVQQPYAVMDAELRTMTTCDHGCGTYTTGLRRWLHLQCNCPGRLRLNNAGYSKQLRLRCYRLQRQTL